MSKQLHVQIRPQNFFETGLCLDANLCKIAQ